MVGDVVAVAGGDLLLQGFDFIAVELDHLAGVEVDHVVVVLATIQLVHGGAAFEVVLEHQPGGFELGQYPVDRGQADVLALRQQLAVDVLGGHVLRLGMLQQLQDA